MFAQKEVISQAAQKNLLILEKLYPHSTNNHRSVAVEIHGHIKLDLFNHALLKVYQRHEMLRAIVNPASTQLNFFIQPAENFKLPFVNLEAPQYDSIPPLIDLSQTLEDLKYEEFLKSPFNLNKGLLWRAVLIKYDEKTYQFSMLFNHIIVDETSIGIIFNDLSRYHQAALTNNPSLEPQCIPSLLDLSFALPDQNLRKQYWQKQLADLNNFNMQTDYSHEKSFNFIGKRHRFTLNKELMTSLENNIAFNGFSLNQILLASLYTLLFHYSNETDICLGITSENRRHHCIDDSTMSQLVNCFFNSLPLRISFTPNTKFLELLKQIKFHISNGLKNQLPLDMIWQHALTPATRAKFQIASPFNIALVLNRLKPTLHLNDTIASNPIELDLGLSKFPYFGINLDELVDGSYECFIEYNTKLFNQKTIQRIAAHYENFLNYWSLHPECHVSQVPFMLAEEKQLLRQFNDTTHSSNPILFHDYFHQIALQQPDEIAVMFHHDAINQTSLTYRELDEYSSKLATYINHLYPEPQKFVGVCLTRSVQLPMAILAIFKASAVFVPLENDNEEAIKAKLNCINLTTIITDHHTATFFRNNNIPHIHLDDQAVQSSLSLINATDIQPRIGAKEIAYLVFTSGTSKETPQPKGVLVSHRSLSNLIIGIEAQAFNPHSKVICTALPTFDAFLYDLGVSMITKGQLHLTPSENRFSKFFIEEIINQYQINFGVFLPTFLRILNPQLSSLDTIISMGSAPHAETLRNLYNARPQRRILNGFGPTEACVCTSTETYHPNQTATLVGRPNPNMQEMILNPITLTICPIGVVGELYISGASLAEGYLNNPELNKLKFPTLIYNKDAGAFEHATSENLSLATRFYATGDYACYQQINDHELSINLIGRKDRQIKLLGVRIDLDEIEDVMRQSPNVADVAIIANENLTALIAYIEPKSQSITLEEITKHLRKFMTQTHLNSVAYPKTYILIPELPINQNGKVNYKKLPQPITLTKPLTQLLNPLETAMLKIWENVLGFSIDPNNLNLTFKELGGTSLSLAALEIELKLNTNFASKKFFQIGTYLNFHMTLTHLVNKMTPDLLSSQNSKQLGPNTYAKGNKLTVFTSSPKPSSPFTIKQKTDEKNLLFTTQK